MKSICDFELHCIQCQEKIPFSIHERLDHLTCSQCKQDYVFSDETLKRQLKKFSHLCEALIEAEEIFSSISVGVNVGDREVKIPYKLLLTRLNTTLDLKVGDKKIKISRRVEPLKGELRV